MRREVFEWLDALDGERPLLLYVHTVEPHDPYSPPPDLRRRFAPKVPPGLEGKPGRNQEATPELVAVYAALYDAEDSAGGPLAAPLVAPKVELDDELEASLRALGYL